MQLNKNYTVRVDSLQFITLGTCPTLSSSAWKNLLAGDVINLTSITVTGWNTRLVFEVIKVNHPYHLLNEGKKGALGYIDLKNVEPGVVSPGAEALFTNGE